MTKADNSDVTVIIPTLNEERSVGKVIRELHHLGYHNIVIIDGNSTDRTVEVAKELGVDILMQNGTGKGEALRQAFGHNGVNGDFVVIMDADGSMDPKEIPMLVEVVESGADVAKASRFLGYGCSEDMSPFRRIGNSVFLMLVNTLWAAKYTDLCYGFGVFRKASLEKLYPSLRSKNFEIETEIFIKTKRMRLKVVEIPSLEYRRFHGKSNLKAFSAGLRILRTIFREFADTILNGK